MLMAMAGIMVYFLVTFAVSADPSLDGLILATGGPIGMLTVAVLCLLAVAIREKSD
jgi:hypothetical protein